MAGYIQHPMAAAPAAAAAAAEKYTCEAAAAVAAAVAARPCGVLGGFLVVDWFIPSVGWSSRLYSILFVFL
jgi:hypothetical protein